MLAVDHLLLSPGVIYVLAKNLSHKLIEFLITLFHNVAKLGIEPRLPAYETSVQATYTISPNAPGEGFEPSTYGLTVRRSAAELPRIVQKNLRFGGSYYNTIRPPFKWYSYLWWSY